jgi:cytochrome c peroxidase
MGDSSADAATYYGTPVASPSPGDLAEAKDQARRSGMAAPTEWRTPPLWGVANSAPYLHDGRANTLDDAIRFHDGEAAKTATRYTRLASSDRRALLAFLNSLTISAERKKPGASPRKRGV